MCPRCLGLTIVAACTYKRRDNYYVFMHCALRDGLLRLFVSVSVPRDRSRPEAFAQRISY